MPQTCLYRIASLPGRGDSNPYVDLFYDALAPHGIELACDLPIDIKWLKRHASQLDAIHFHWPDLFLWEYDPAWWHYLHGAARRLPPAASKVLLRLARVMEIPKRICGVLYLRKMLNAAKRAGLRVVWTFHNVESHFNPDWVDRVSCRILASSSDLIIFHSDFARTECLQRYKPRGELVVMPHGTYEGVFPTARPRSEVLQELGLRADLPVVGCVGGLRNNKGLDIAVEAVAQLYGKVQFIVAGHPVGGFNVEVLRASMKNIPGTVFLPRLLSNQEFADVVGVSEAMLLPYRQVAGSGALLAAITLGCGVIASDLPYFREVLKSEPHSGVLVRPDDADALADGIKRYLMVPGTIRKDAVRSLAHRYKWSEVVVPIVDMLRKWAEQRGVPHLTTKKWAKEVFSSEGLKAH